MTARPVAQYLARFDSTEASEPAATQEDPICLPLSAPGPAEDPAVLIEAAREEGLAKGLAEGLAAGRAENGAELARERLLFEARLSAERARWIKEESEKLGGKFVAALAELEAHIAGSVARVLRGFLIEALRGKAVEELAEDLRALLAGKEHPLVEISGPADLLALLREKLSRFADAIEYAENQSPDVVVVADQTIIETRIEAWIERVKAMPE